MVRGPVNVTALSYNHPMPLPASVAAAIVNSVINSVTEVPPATQQLELYSSVTRTFPAETKLGNLSPPVQDTVQIGGQVLQAAPGLQIRNTQNLIVLPASLQQTVPVRYQLDTMGNVYRIWILSAAEVAAANSQ